MLINELLKKTKIYDDIILDLDDTIYQQNFFDIGAYREIEEYFCKFNKKFYGIAKYLGELRLIFGVEYRKLFDDAVLRYDMKHDNVQKMIDIYSHHDARNLSYKSSLVPQLKEIAGSGKKRLYIVTNGKRRIQQQKIRMLGADTITTDIIICSPDEPKKMKPCTWAFEILNKKYSLNNSVMVGDTENIDGEFAKNSGIDFIYFNYKDCELYENI